MAESTNNPLTKPGAAGNTPGTDVDMTANGLYPNAVEQTYYEAGGSRKLGEARKTNYRGTGA
jgi:hypothetical protein